MKYIVLAWLTDWVDEKLISGNRSYNDAYVITDENGKLKLFDTDYEALTFARNNCKYFKIIDFHNYMVGNKQCSF